MRIIPSDIEPHANGVYWTECHCTSFTTVCTECWRTGL